MPQKHPEIQKRDKFPPSHAQAGKVGVVVIGRNEGDRLKRCLTSLRQQTDGAIVYVDSGSTDDSVRFAKSLDCHTVDLDPATSFSMARARNTGFRQLHKEMPGVRYVQFVDGDCEVEPGWIAKAAECLDQSDAITVVCGFRRERHPHASVYNHLTDMEWQGKTGEVDACGGDAMYRIDAFGAAGGFNEFMIAGEEPELCVRLKQAGGRIWRLDVPMTVHDAALTKFSQWWTRSRRGGYACAHGIFLHGRSAQPGDRRRLMSSLFYGFVVPTIWCAGIIASLHFFSVSMAVLFTILAVVFELKPALGAFRYRQELGNSNADASLDAAFCVLSKLPEALGILKFAIDRTLGKQTRLIEYKGAGN